MLVNQNLDVTFNGLDLLQISEKYFRQNKKPISFDFKASVRQMLPEGYSRAFAAHGIHYYPGRIFPYIPLFMLSLNDFAKLKGPVLDLFAGCGTVLLESIINPFTKRISIGVEKNPIGRLISKVKTTLLDEQTIDMLLEEICKSYNSAKSTPQEVLEFTNRQLWFSEKATAKLSKLKDSIKNVTCTEEYKDFFWLCFSIIVRRVSKANPYIPPPVVLKPEKYISSKPTFEKLTVILANSEDPAVLKEFTEVVMKNKKKLIPLNHISELKKGDVFSEIIWDDARKIMRGKSTECGRILKQSAQALESNSIGLVLTSPPYLTAQKYIRTNKLELFWLGYDRNEVMSLERGSVGTEAISMKTKLSPVGVKSIDDVIVHINDHSRERAIQVYQYFKDMMITLGEINRVLQKNSYAIIVIGDNRVLKKSMETYRLLADTATEIGLSEVVILKDTIRSRSMLTKRNGTGGIIKNEYVLVLKKVL